MNRTSKQVVVTGATGAVGGALLNYLQESGVAVRAVTRDPQHLGQRPGIESVQGDLTRPESLRPALRGSDSLFLLMTAGQQAGPVDVQAVVRVAKSAGVKRIVLVSSLLSELYPDSSRGRLGLQAEQVVRESGLEWTILRPWEFASNALAWVPALRTEGAVRAPTSGFPSPAIHPADIARVAFQALTEPGHSGEIYPLTGPQSLTPQDKVRAIGEAAGRPFIFLEQPDPKALEQIAAQAPDEVTAQMMIPGVCGLKGPAVLPTAEQVTGAPARTFQEWARDNAQAFR